MNGAAADQVLIAGGGIAGLTTALALRHFDIPCRVLERDQFQDQVGTGIQLSPNATRVLFQLGLGDRLRERALMLPRLETRNWKSGRTISNVAINHEQTRSEHAPYLHIKRADLIEILAAAAHDTDEIAMQADECVVDFQETDECVSLTTNKGSYRAELLLGCDGTHSTVRRLLGLVNSNQRSHWTAWRTIVEAPVDRPVFVQLWMGPTAHVVLYPIQRNELNLVVINRTRESFKGSWRALGTRDDLHRTLAGWNSEIQSLLDSIEPARLFRWGIAPHDPVTSASFASRVALLGDAWHTILPFLAQGAALAIEDAFVCARSLAAEPSDVATAIEDFHERRYRRVNRIRAISSMLGNVYRLRQPWALWRDLAGSFAARRLQSQVFNFDATLDP